MLWNFMLIWFWVTIHEVLETKDVHRSKSKRSLRKPLSSSDVVKKLSRKTCVPETIAMPLSTFWYYRLGACSVLEKVTGQIATMYVAASDQQQGVSFEEPLESQLLSQLLLRNLRQVQNHCANKKKEPHVSSIHSLALLLSSFRTTALVDCSSRSGLYILEKICNLRNFGKWQFGSSTWRKKWVSRKDFIGIKVNTKSAQSKHDTQN